MWRLDIHGTCLDDADAAREELRRRAWLAISDGLKYGRDVRHHRVRVQDEDGDVVFEGTLAEAVASDTRCYVPPARQQPDAVADAAHRIRHEAASNRQALTTARDRLSRTVALAGEELRIAEQLVAASRSFVPGRQSAPR